MNFDFSITEAPVAIPSVALRTVFVVHADLSYHVRKNLPENRDWVALRTIGGTGSVHMEDGGRITVTPGTLLLFEHRKVREYDCFEENWDFWWFEFKAAGTLSLPANTLFYPDSIPEEEALFETCLHSLKKGTSAYHATASASFSLLLLHWTASLSAKHAQSHPHQAAVEKVISHLRTHLASNVSIKEMAHLAGLCERRFREVFEAITGQQPKKFASALRLGMAEELLKNTPFPISDIAERLGYSSPFHFSREFSRAYGMPPSALRNRKKE